MKNIQKSIYKDNMKCAESVRLSAMPEVFVNEKDKELDTTQTWITDKIDAIEFDDDQIEPTKSEQYKRENESDEIQNKKNGKIDEIELNVEQIDKQWEGVNELLLQITTFLIFNTTSLLIAVFAITWTKGGTVFNRTLILHSQETIGTFKNDNLVQILQVTKVKKYKTCDHKFQFYFALF